MTDSYNEFRIEEYKQVREEINQLDKGISQLLIISLVTSISLLSGIGAFFFKLDATKVTELSPLFGYLFLGSQLIVTSFFPIIISYRKLLHRAGTYIHVFYDEHGVGTGWEKNVTRFREFEKGESQDYVPLIYFSVWIFSTLLFYFAVVKMANGSNWNLIAPFIFFIILSILSIAYLKASEKARNKYFGVWKSMYTSNERYRPKKIV